MSPRDEALLFKCDEAACHEDPMFYEIFTMDDRWSIILAILDAAKVHEDSLKTAQGEHK